MVGKIKGRRKRGHQKMRWLDDVIDAMDINLSKLWEMVRQGGLHAAVHPRGQRVRHNLATEQQQNPILKSEAAVLLAGRSRTPRQVALRWLISPLGKFSGSSVGRWTLAMPGS